MTADPLLAELEARLRAAWDDDECWAVYADALLARGDPRGELVSLELRCARGDPREQPALRAAIEAIQAAHEHAWCPGYSAAEQRAYVWRRGFIVGLRTRELNDSEDVESLARALAEPQLRMLARLELRMGENVQPELFGALGELELGALRALQLAYTPVGNACLAALRALPRTLVELDLRYAGLDDEGLARMLALLYGHGAGAANLRRLRLQHNQIGAAGVALLARCEQLGQLGLLDLRANPLTRAGVASLARSELLGQLETLALEFEDVGSEGANALAAGPKLPAHITRFWAARAYEQRQRTEAG